MRAAPGLDAILNCSKLYYGFAPPALLDAPVLKDPRILPSSLGMETLSNPTVEYVYRVEERLVIEPTYGYGLIRPCTLLDISLPRSEFTHDPAKMLDFYGLPSIREIANYGKRRAVRRVPAVISLRFPHEQNYSHVLLDILARLTLLDELGVARDVPILISKRTAELTFFKQMRECGDLRDREWIVQGEEYVETDLAYFSRSSSEGQRKRLVGVAKLLGGPEPDLRSGRRIFLQRDGTKVGRAITNLEELRPIIDRYNLEVVDPASLTFVEQAKLFSEARVVVGGHGAGLTNILFRRTAPMDLIELFPPNETPLHFYAMASALGHGYSFLIGDNPIGNGRQVSFHVDPEAFERQVGETILGCE